ncbi:MAG: relaxase/mobilization nuclease domain-containing protein [Candidatus Onthomonas sp.]
MAITKILSRKARLDVGIRYVLNGDKTDHQILTARLNCEEGQEYRQMMATKQETGKTGGPQFFHIIQSFRPGEVTPEEALEIARELALEHLSEYEVVIGTHVDREHIHSHILFNSVSTYTGRKYHSTRESYRQIQELSDRICRAHGLSVIEAPAKGSSLSYGEWRRQKLGQPTFRAMLEVDVKACIEDANDLGHFYMLMEHRGYEISHRGNRLGFRFRGQERFVCPGRKNPLYTEEGIQRVIDGNLEAIALGEAPVVISRPRYVRFRPNPKYPGIVGLYCHYLYLLRSIRSQQYPKTPTYRMRRAVLQFERYKRQFAFLREHNLTSGEDLSTFARRTETELADLIKRRTIANAANKQRKPLNQALADEAAFAPLAAEASAAEQDVYWKAKALLDNCGISREQLTAEKAETYQQLAELNRQIRAERKNLALCREIQSHIPEAERLIREAEERPTVRQRRRDEVER